LNNQPPACGIEEAAGDKRTRSGRWKTMAKVFSITAKAAAPIAACFLASLLLVVARAQDKVQLTGHWNFNQDQSDDAEQKLRELSGRVRKIVWAA
jgi:hypothetical protein